MNLSILEHPLLTTDRETELLERICKTTSVVVRPSNRKDFFCTDNEAQDELLRHNERLIYSIAKKYLSISAPGTEIDDLMQEGRKGLLRAAHKWDPKVAAEKSVGKFSTYATWWIRQFVRRYALRHRSGLSRSYNMDEFALKIRKVIDRLTKELERDPTREEIVDACGYSEARVSGILDAPKVVSIDASEEHAGRMAEVSSLYQIPDRTAPTARQIEDRLTAQQYLERLDHTHPRLATILRMRYGLNGHGETPMSLNEIAREYGITRQRVEQLEKEALQVLRDIG